MSFYGRPELADDVFHFGELTLYLGLDRQERVRHWSYETPSGPAPLWEQVGALIHGKKLHDAWHACIEAGAHAQAAYWQLGRMLGYWPVRELASPLVCRCFGVSRAMLESELEKKPESDLSQLRAQTRASVGCGTCRPQVEKLIQNYRDQHALVINGWSMPGGHTPLQLLIRLQAYFKHWQAQRPGQLSQVKFLGVRHYDVFVTGHETEATAWDEFVVQSRRELGLNWRVQDFGSPA